MNYTTYNPETGQITGHLSGDDYLVMPLHSLPGHIDSAQFYIHQGQPRPYPQVPRDLQSPRFDYASHSWTEDTLALAHAHRQRRLQLLKGVIDRVNPVWFSELSPEQRVQLTAYRRALLDVPQQPGFPHTVTWPDLPSWIK